jgi:tetratricopeptide (TPR) repeat protein
MLAEKMDRLDLLEGDLRKILEQQPDHPQALNALGYTLADRTDRHQEAYELIKRALELAPGDFYILDSMGWVLYRLGRMDEAIKYLQEAMALRPDPEIAAHLGEVLWVTGNKDAAREVWDTALKATPDDTSLLDVIRRFSP